jgi:DNA-binding beta-propeller fold protein YncE/tRNA A-37 threonylcarbamoyl transferase component Bud32
VTVTIDPRIGTELLGYRIEALIGRGGMSVVYRAEDLRLKRKVALKLMASELAEDERFRERFLRESELAASLDHPHIVPIYGAGEHEGQLYIAMRYVEGSDLKELLKQEGALDPKRALGLLEDLADALDAAHARGLVHRDVKPSNALLDEAGHVYLSDFGLTKSASDRSAQTLTGRIVGTVDYAAPEQIEGKPIDGRADVYSLGCLLYECLTGEVPFPRDSELAVLWAQVNEPPPKASERKPRLPQAIDAVTAKALAKDPAERYSSGRELVEAAREALGLRDVIFIRDRRPLLLAALGALLAAGAVAAGLVLSLGGGGAKPDLTVRNNTLVRIDPKTSKIAGVINVGQGPEAAAVGGGSVWVYNWDDHTVSVVDATRATVVRTLSIAGTAPLVPVNSIAADRSGAWVLSTSEGTALLTRLRLGPVDYRREFPLPYDPVSVTVGGGAVWVAAKRIGPSVIFRIDPKTGSILYTATLRGAVVDPQSQFRDVRWIAVGAHAVWAVQGRTIFRLDPATGRLIAKANIPGQELAAVAADRNTVWVAIFDPARGNRLTRIDPATLKPTKTIPAPSASDSTSGDILLGSSGAFALADDALWWNAGGSGTVWRADPQVGRVVSTVRLTPPLTDFSGFGPYGIAWGAGSVWVTVRLTT